MADESATRIVVICAVGAASDPLAAATADAGRDAGLGVRLVVADSADTAAPSGESDDAPWATALTAALAALGGSALPLAATAGLGDARRAAALERIRAVAQDPEVDLVVVDAGDERAARDLLAHPAAVGALLDAALGPDLAMGSTDDEAGVFDRLTTARGAAAELGALLCGPGVTWRIAAPPRPEAVHEVLGALSALVVLGARVDGIVVDPYPRKRAGVDQRADAAAALAALAELAGISVWRSGPGRPAVPKGIGIAGPAGPVAEVSTQAPFGDDDAWEWGLAIPQAVASRVRIGVQDDHLVLESGGSYRWLELPPVLRRTTAVEAVRQESGFLVRFRPDPAVWRARAAADEDEPL